MRFFLVLPMFLFVAPSVVWAGAWLQEPGTAYARVSGGYLSTQTRFDENGDKVQWDTSGGGLRNSKYQDFGASFYTEVGVAPGWNAVASVSWKRLVAAQPSANFKTFGFSDVHLGVKRAVWSNARVVSSVAVGLTLPTGYDVDDYPSLGSDATDVSVTGSVGTSSAGFWGTADVEYRWRGGVFRDVLGGSLGGGFSPATRLGLRGELRGGSAVGSGSASADAIRFDPATVDPSHLDVAGTASYAVGRGLALEAEVRSTVSGENTLAGTRFGFALATQPAVRWSR